MGDRCTQLWEASVADEATGVAIAHFRCTQMILFPNLKRCLE